MIILKKNYKESTDMIHFYPQFSTEEELPDGSEISIDGNFALVYTTDSEKSFWITPGVSLEIYSDKGALEI